MTSLVLGAIAIGELLAIAWPVEELFAARERERLARIASFGYRWAPTKGRCCR